MPSIKKRAYAAQQAKNPKGKGKVKAKKKMAPYSRKSKY